ncbi:hypothetical protein EON65_10155 [archaeon]|nr:MAG: hypothetical protein EON65_10155 [archaeon]
MDLVSDTVCFWFEACIYEFNSYVSVVAVCVACAGVYYPIATTALSLTYTIGRVLYSIGYTSKNGADGRRVGVLMADVALIAVFGMAMYGGFNSAGGLAKLKAIAGL